MADDRPPSTDGGSDSWVRRLGRSLAGAPRTRDELNDLLREAMQRELIDADALLMIAGVMEATETPVEDVMVPRSQMVVVTKDADPAEILNVVVGSGHSRFPVIGDSRDEVVGILLAKELLHIVGSAPEELAKFRLADNLRPPVFIPENKRLNVLLKDFRSSRNHMAIVVDEFGGVSGLVTIEDVLETIVGDIDDEYDEDEGSNILRQDSRRYLVRGLTSIEEFNQYFGAEFSDEEFDTVGGLVTHHFGHLPKRGESSRIESFQFNVNRADSRRVHLLQVTVDNDIRSSTG